MMDDRKPPAPVSVFNVILAIFGAKAASAVINLAVEAAVERRKLYNARSISR